ncbi:MAG: hypothetical protein GW779_02830 [Candidatus Altiarchaeum hamiconexum]|uniref:Uncharacterized protein n=1 Tax=Candidatus Altarchaeum hamiconexum TaxID=1803513 RepID=A0A8J7YUF7_9ARCH|nr:hypothetical protein [Candidatus Altarchaeum hamiconexum]NCN68972.1 hypothetical protein [Candidatus Altarchaeum hamiconexum]NCS91342.1 hypothetical protein [Candidatus Altarchaeum hamiconexum]NCT01310.1 hypothetical protein [Candidatus Altarchaeum hamiconexum]
MNIKSEELKRKRIKKIKGLDQKFKNQNLRDHMTDMELIFTRHGDASTAEITKSDDSKGFEECLESFTEGGKIAGNARQELKKRKGKKVVSRDIYYKIIEKVQKLENDLKPVYQKRN